MGRVQSVDISVSRAKFDREVAQYRALEGVYRQQRGWLLLKADFPEVVVGFVLKQLRPMPLAFAVRLDFTDYDFRPPAVQLVDPITWEPYLTKALPTELKRTVPLALEYAVHFQAAGVMAQGMELPLMQNWGPDTIPFLCLAGVREYHEQPAHTGDSWLLHRRRGPGTLAYIVDVIYRYGAKPINNPLYQVAINWVGYQQESPPP